MTYIWKVELQERWSYAKNWNRAETYEYTVSAPTYEKALEKADKCAKKKSFLDDDVDGDGKLHTVVETRLVSINRGDQLDA